MHPSIALSLSLLLLPAVVSATEWESLLKKPGTELLVDLDSYDESGAYSLILAKLETHEKQWVSKQMKLAFDCQKQSYRTLATVSFDSKGKLLGQSSGIKEFRSVKRDEYAETVAGLVCQVRRMVNPSS